VAGLEIHETFGVIDDVLGGFRGHVPTVPVENC
jgi:hypothetical protein